MNELRRILFLSHSHVFGAFRVGSHHYARELARRGVEIVHLSTPISRAHRLFGRVRRCEDSAVPHGPHTDTDGVVHLVPRTALPAPYGPFSVMRALARHGIRPGFDAVLIDQPLLWKSSIRALSPRLVYRATDLYPSGVKARMQRSIIASADAVIATSSQVLRALGDVDLSTLVLENGVDASYFAPLPAEDSKRPSVCVYVGALDTRFDWQQIAAWAHSHPDSRFIVAGPSPEPTETLPANVELIGAVQYDKLPSLLHGARVGMLPLSHNLLNDGRSPMKLYEYLAAGLAVISRETPVVTADESAGLFTYSGAGDEALNRALAHPSPNAEGVRRAQRESWTTKTDRLMEFLRILPGH